MTVSFVSLKTNMTYFLQTCGLQIRFNEAPSEALTTNNYLLLTYLKRC